MLEGLTNEEENLIFETKPELFSIGTITNSYEIISLLNIGRLKVNEECDLEQQTLD